MNTKRYMQSIMSLLVAFIMLFSCIPAYADWYHDMAQGSGGGSSGTKGSWNTVWIGEEFIRCSIWFFEGGIESNNTPIAVGLPTDVRNPKYSSLRYGTPQYYSEPRDNKNTARWYNINNGEFQAGSETYYNMVMPNLAPGKTHEEFKANEGNTTLEFPILFTVGNGGNNGVDAKEYFSNYSVKNALLASVQGNKYDTSDKSGGCWQGIEDMESGNYNAGGGVTMSGQYIILLEPGIYCSTSGVSAAFTFRDLIKLNEVNDILHNFVDPVKNCAHSLRVTDADMWVNSLGLTGNAGIETLTSPIYDPGQLSLAKQKLGAGVITCSPSVGQLPVINYYYDLSGSGGIKADNLDDLNTVYTPVYSEDTKSFDEECFYSTKNTVQGNEYKAPLVSKPYESAEEFTLVMGYMELVDDTDGNLDIKEDWHLQFYDTSLQAEIPEKCVTHTNSRVTSEDDVRVWNKSKYLVSSTEKNAELTGISEKLIQQDGDSLKAVYGTSVGKYQAVFLYVKMPDDDDDERKRKGTIPKTPDPHKNEEVLKIPTNFTKMYFEKEDDVTPIEIETGGFPRSDTYTVTKSGTPVNGDNYEMKKWVIVTDNNPGVPDNLGTWSDVESNKSPEDSWGEGDTPGGLGPSHWSDPNREIFIKYVKVETPPTPATGQIDHILTEKRITKRYTLAQNYEMPRFLWSWPSADGHHTHEPHKNAKHKAHDCDQSVDDPYFNFVVSNLLKVNDNIMGNKTYFKPYDVNNVKPETRGQGEGETDITGEDYGYVVWRGRDIPTLASYKYDNTTKQNTAEDKTNYTIANNLIPSGKISMSVRHKENGHNGGQGFYNEGFQVKYGQISRDTGLTGDGGTSTPKENYNIGDFTWRDRWSYINHGSDKQARKEEPEERPVEIEGGVRVDIGHGTANIGDVPVTFLSENLRAFDIDFDNILGYPINNITPIKLYPYVEMIFDTTTGLDDMPVLVLGGHESTLLPRDYVEIGYKTKAIDGSNRTGLLLESKQWSTHTSAKRLGSAQTVLPGGAIFNLRTPGSGSENTRTVVGMSSWLTFLPEDTIEAVFEGHDKYSLEDQIERNEDLYKQVLNSFNNLDIVQFVNNEKVLYEQKGSQRVSGTSGQATSPDAKYWLKQNLEDGGGHNVTPSTVEEAISIKSTATNEADLDIVAHKEERIYYRIYSDVKGNVYLTKADSVLGTASGQDGEILGQISKGQSAEALINQSDEIKALNNRTNIVTNYIKAIDRNIGNDTSVSDSKWYNEAFDGICVVRVNKYMELGFKDTGADSATRTSALDPKFCPPLQNQSDMYSKKATSWFQSEAFTNAYHPSQGYEEGHVGTYTTISGEKINIKLDQMDGLYRTKNFYIPNVTVMNLY